MSFKQLPVSLMVLSDGMVHFLKIKIFFYKSTNTISDWVLASVNGPINRYFGLSENELMVPWEFWKKQNIPQFLT